MTSVGPSLADRIDSALPQTQCRRCGYVDCRAYAEAISSNVADINRCPPGGQEGVRRLAVITGRAVMPLDPNCGAEGPLMRARIDESACIGCALCLKACPVDSILGAPKRMHTVITAQCTGCALCIPVCPVDCITMHAEDDGQTGWNAWSAALAEMARARYDSHRRRQAAQAHAEGVSAFQNDADSDATAAKASAVQLALQRAKTRARGA